MSCTVLSHYNQSSHLLSHTLLSYDTLSSQLSYPLINSHTLSSTLTLSLNSADIDMASLNDQIEKIVSAIERMKKEDSTTPEEFLDPKDDQNLDW